MSFKRQLEKLWNTELKEKDQEPWRQRGLRLLVGFMILMLAFTFLSRAADSLSVAKIETQLPEQKIIEQRIEAEGRVTAKQEKLVYTDSDLLVESVLVKSGQRVKAGETLFTVSMADLQKKIDEAELEIQKMELENQDYVNQIEAKNAKKSLDLQRAREDYENAQTNGEAQVNAANNALLQAQQNLAQYYEEKNQQTLDNQASASGVTLDGSEKETALLADVKEKEEALDNAKQAKEEAIKEASRAIEDLCAPESTDHALEINQLELSQKKRELEKWKSLYEQQGKIAAQLDSVVTKVGVATGERTGEIAVCLANEEAGFQFEAQITKEQAKIVEKGNEVCIKKSQGNSSIKGLAVESVQANAEDEDIFDVVIPLSDAQLGIGETATMTVTKKSSPYPCCVPLQAVRNNGQTDYVLVLQEEETILGKVKTLRSVTVEILDKNERFAALSEESLGNDQEVAVNSDRAVEEGSRVRLDNK